MSFFAACYHIDGLVARKRYTALLEQVGLNEKLDFYVDGLSRGMKQRLCLARALIHDPQILILDEPTSGLDPRTRVEFKEILEDLKFAGKTILISSHVLSELSEMCTDIGIIDQGMMILEGNIQDILSRVNASNPLVISVSVSYTHLDVYKRQLSDPIELNPNLARIFQEKSKEVDAKIGRASCRERV